MADRLQVSTEFLDLRTTHPFIIARGGRSEYRTLWVRLRDADGNEGWGEAAPSKFYGETAESAMAARAPPCTKTCCCDTAGLGVRAISTSPGATLSNEAQNVCMRP